MPALLDADDAREVLAATVAEVTAALGLTAPAREVALQLDQHVANLAARLARVTRERDAAERRAPVADAPDALDLDAIVARERFALDAARERLRCERLDPGSVAALAREERRADDALRLVAALRAERAEAERTRAQLAALAGAKFAAQHPHAAGAMLGGVAHREDVTSG